MIAAELIRKKRFNKALTEAEIDWLVQSYATGELPDYQMAALAMAICFNGMSPNETFWLTRSMMNSGVVLDFSQYHPGVVDKHSTGGVGDKTSLILAPLVAGAGVKVPMIAGRGLGHTGGTLDKLESIPGFNVNLSLDDLKQNVEKHGFSIIGQTAEICPADKKLYALRDVTGTVDSLPLICGSIMSKKLAEGLSALVLDVKWGSGAFMKNQKDAHELATALKSIGEHQGVKTHALITSMNQPLGAYIGNALEVVECVEIMSSKTREVNGTDLYEDTRELTLQLAAEMLFAGNACSSPEEGYEKASEILRSGRALENFEKMVEFQGGKLSEFQHQSRLKHIVTSSEAGFVNGFEVEALGLASLQLGAGRKTSADKIDPFAGIEVHKKIGDKVEEGEALFTLYYSNEGQHEAALPYVEKSCWLSQVDKPAPKLIESVLR
ncbi:MAG: thymidine phosphorylase [Bdellovibrionales bacterium]|nr:thymidine phosphorylase [Bdellovibrionales bacterium]